MLSKQFRQDAQDTHYASLMGSLLRELRDELDSETPDVLAVVEHYEEWFARSKRGWKIYWKGEAKRAK